MVSSAPTGSTTPESTPPAKDLALPIPSERRGMEMMAPSGMLWRVTAGRNAHPPTPGGLLHGGDQQAPDGRSNHNAGGKTGQSALHPIPQTLFQEEYTGSAQGGTEKWGEKAPKSHWPILVSLISLLRRSNFHSH